MNTVLKLLVLGFVTIGAPALSEAKCTPHDPFEQEGCLKPYPAQARLTCIDTAEQREVFTIVDNQPQIGLATLTFADRSTSTVNFALAKTQQQTRWIDTYETKTYIHPYFTITLSTQYVSYEHLTQTGVYYGNITAPNGTAKALYCTTN